MRPAPLNTGIVFIRSDLAAAGCRKPSVAALWHNVVTSQLCTLIRNECGVEVSTIEHIMAAFAGCAVDNVLVEITDREVPILDGSAAGFVTAIDEAGVVTQSSKGKVLKVLRPVEVSRPGAWARLEPADHPEIDFTIDFPDRIIGHQHRRHQITEEIFRQELSQSRTFCRWTDVETMQSNGLALGGSIESSVVVDGDRVLTPGGLRWSDEPVRHKMLDALGDLYLAGALIQGRFTGMKSGHALTSRLLKKAFHEQVLA